jgi:hypothetical protein
LEIRGVSDLAIINGFDFSPFALQHNNKVILSLVLLPPLRSLLGFTSDLFGSPLKYRPVSSQLNIF